MAETTHERPITNQVGNEFAWQAEQMRNRCILLSSIIDQMHDTIKVQAAQIEAKNAEIEALRGDISGASE